MEEDFVVFPKLEVEGAPGEGFVFGIFEFDGFVDGAGARVVLDDVFGFDATGSGDAEPEGAAGVLKAVCVEDGAVFLAEGVGDVGAGVDSEGGVVEGEFAGFRAGEAVEYEVPGSRFAVRGFLGCEWRRRCRGRWRR